MKLLMLNVLVPKSSSTFVFLMPPDITASKKSLISVHIYKSHLPKTPTIIYPVILKYFLTLSSDLECCPFPSGQNPPPNSCQTQHQTQKPSDALSFAPGLQLPYHSLSLLSYLNCLTPGGLIFPSLQKNDAVCSRKDN